MKKLANIACIIFQIIGLVLVAMFNNTNRELLCVGCGVLITSMTIWMILNPVETEEDAEWEE